MPEHLLNSLNAKNSLINMLNFSSIKRLAILFAKHLAVKFIGKNSLDVQCRLSNHDIQI
jgi:hypothetical protein